jgi:protein-S-isoprenylcysteine O-methyltransferase Ste14
MKAVEFLTELRLGWLNGWLLFSTLVLTEGVLFLAFRRDTVQRLFDRSGWPRWMIALTVMGKFVALAVILLIIFSPLKIGHPVLVFGAVLVLLGLVGLVKALFDFRNTPQGQPATQGIYKITRHPQILSSNLIILGCTIAIGSWLAMILLVIARVLMHANLVAEEEVCLRAYGETYRDYTERVPRYLLF